MSDHDPKDPLDRLAKSVQASKPRKRQSKSTRTHTLAEPQYKVFADYCRSKGLSASEVLDGLIYAFLEKVRDDLPIDWSSIEQQIE